MSAKEMLYERIRDLTEEEAQQVLDESFSVKKLDPKQALWERLSKISGIRVPKGGFKPFRHVEPLEGEGIPASQMLLEDRR